MPQDYDREDELWDVAEDYDEFLYDEDDDGIVELVACPSCGVEVYEDAERCPACGDYIVHAAGGHPWKDRPLWWIALGLLGIVAVIMALTVF